MLKLLRIVNIYRVKLNNYRSDVLKITWKLILRNNTLTNIQFTRITRITMKISRPDLDVTLKCQVYFLVPYYYCFTNATKTLSLIKNVRHFSTSSNHTYIKVYHAYVRSMLDRCAACF